MEIFHYFEPCKIEPSVIPGINLRESLGGNISFFNGKKSWFRNFDYHIVLIGVPESRNGLDNPTCQNAPDQIRPWLYALRKFDSEVKIADLGNIRGNSLNDRYQALQDAVSYFLSKGSVVLILGGSQDLSWPAFKSVRDIYGENTVLSVADAMVDVDAEGEDFTSRSWISYLLQQSKDLPDDLTIFGTQNYLISPSQEKFIKKKFFDIVRLADIRGEEIEKCEVILRDSDFFSMDFRVLKDQPQFHSNTLSPHGIEPYEACRIWRYAGYSDRIKVGGLFDMPALDSGNNALLAAQMIWHFVDGYCGREKDYPFCSVDVYKCYVVPFEEVEDGIKFYQNLNNNRWWMEIFVSGERKIASCFHEDYPRALKKEFPEKWWRLYLKKTESQGDRSL